MFLFFASLWRIHFWHLSKRASNALNYCVVTFKIILSYYVIYLFALRNSNPTPIPSSRMSIFLFECWMLWLLLIIILSQSCNRNQSVIGDCTIEIQVWTQKKTLFKQKQKWRRIMKKVFWWKWNLGWHGFGCRNSKNLVSIFLHSHLYCVYLKVRSSQSEYTNFLVVSQKSA